MGYKFEDISTYLMSINMRAGNSLLKNESSFIDAAKRIGIDVNKRKNTIDGFIVHPDGDRDYGNLSDEVIGIVDECKRIAGLIEDAPTEQDAEAENAKISALQNEIDIAAAQDARADEPEAEAMEAELVEDVPDKPVIEKKTKESKTMKETALEPVHQDQNRALADVKALPITLDTVKAHICKGATNQELALFIETCRSHNLNPFIDEIYLVKYGSAAAATVIGKGVFLDRAFNNPAFDGFKAGIIVLDESGEIQRREGAFRLDTEILVGGWCEVYMKNKEHPYVGEIRLADYIKTKSDGKPTKFWATIPETMIRKVALSQTLKEAMPSEFNQLWDADALVIDAEVVD